MMSLTTNFIIVSHNNSEILCRIFPRSWRPGWGRRGLWLWSRGWGPNWGRRGWSSPTRRPLWLPPQDPATHQVWPDHKPAVLCHLQPVWVELRDPLEPRGGSPHSEAWVRMPVLRQDVQDEKPQGRSHSPGSPWGTQAGQSLWTHWHWNELKVQSVMNRRKVVEALTSYYKIPVKSDCESNKISKMQKCAKLNNEK